MMYFLTNIFNTKDFPARWNCGNWSDFHGWLHILSDLGVWSAYFAIPCVLLYFVLKRDDLPFRKIFVLFVAFILLCGLTHLMDATIFWWPAYRLSGLIKLATATVSWITVLGLVRVAPLAIAMRSPEELEREIAARKKAEFDLQRANDELERRVEQRTAELAASNRALHDEREWFSTTLTSIGDAVITTDLEGRVTMLNPLAVQLTGWTSEEASGRPLSDVFQIVNEATREAVENPAVQALKENVIIGLANHTILIARDGTERPIDDSAAPIRYEEGQVVGCVLVFRDVTERRQADKAVRESETRLAQLADNISQLVWMAGPGGRIIWYNQRWYEYTGMNSDELQNWQNAVHPDDEQRVVKKLEQCFETGDMWEDTFPLRGGDGVFRWFLSRAVPIRDSAGRIDRWFGTFTDITEQRDTQEKLRMLAAKLSEDDRRKDAFLATLAHELRNPLAPISMGLEVMKMSPNDAGRMEEVRGMMERQTKQLVVLVDDLLDVSRISRGKLQLRQCPVAIKEVVKNAVETTRPMIDAARHEFTLSMPENPVTVFADPNRLAQVFSNLLNNAAKYTPDEGHIRLTVEPLKDDVVISVKDNGIGIPAERLEEIFEMFNQIEHPIQRITIGLGIGLTLVKSLVELHGGTIDVQSAGVGQGSTFSVRLPMSDEPPAEVSSSHQASPSTAGSASSRVLVVDDNKAAANMVTMAIKMLGNEVRTAGNGQEAIDIAAEFLPDVVVMDIGMPIMNGYEAAAYIRHQEWGEKMLLVALTGWGKDEDKRRSKEAGFDYHLVKPAEPSQLRELIELAKRKFTP
ncbi:MAG: PAS domain S-box protein [Planctomycetaceae bacterium]